MYSGLLLIIFSAEVLPVLLVVHPARREALHGAPVVLGALKSSLDTVMDVFWLVLDKFGRLGTLSSGHRTLRMTFPHVLDHFGPFG